MTERHSVEVKKLTNSSQDSQYLQREREMWRSLHNQSDSVKIYS